MRNPKTKIILSLLFFILILNTVGTKAQEDENATNTASTTNKEDQVNISLPIQKSDFLLFYGLTGDKDTDAKLLELRKDFTNKFDILKNNYQESVKSIIADKVLLPAISIDDKENDKDIEVKTAPQTQNLKSVKIDNSQINVTTIKSNNASSNTKNIENKQNPTYILNDLKEGMITPIINIINDTPTIKIETSSWFQKIKTWFGW